jgi:ABC-type Fe3+ transport system permease subunit
MVSFLSLREKIFARLGSFGAAGRIALLLGLLIVATALIFWIFNQIFFYFAAKTYVDEISQAYNLNRGFTNAIVWATFALFVFFAGCAFSLSKTRRTLGVRWRTCARDRTWGSARC